MSGASKSHLGGVRGGLIVNKTSNFNVGNHCLFSVSIQQSAYITSGLLLLLNLDDSVLNKHKRQCLLNLK